MPVDLVAAQAAIVDALTAAGVAACIDERDLNTPGIYLAPPVLAYRFGGRCAEATWTAWAVVPNTGRDLSTANLSELLARTQAALGGAVTSARPADLSVPDQGPPLPAYQLTWTTKID